MPYIGKSPSSGVRQRYQYTATAGQTTFSGTDLGNLTLTYTDNNFLDCFQNGVLLKGGGTDYTATSGTSVVLATGASASDVIEIIVYDVFSVGNFFNRTDSDSRYVNVSGDTMTGSLDLNGTELVLDADGDTSIEASTDDVMTFKTANSERARLDASGNFLISKTSSSSATDGFEYLSGGQLAVTRNNDTVLLVNRRSNHGNIIDFRIDNNLNGVIGTNAGFLQMYSTTSGCGGIQHNQNGSIPINNSGTATDNTRDLGQSNFRWDDVFATNGTIQTSDENEKQDIASATAKELNVAKKLSTLFKTFRWKDKVTEKGDKARTHTGIVAQEVQSAFSAEGLDASNYGLFTSDTWTNEDGEEQTRLGVRYPELFSFIFSSIEARLTALESK